VLKVVRKAKPLGEWVELINDFSLKLLNTTETPVWELIADKLSLKIERLIHPLPILSFLLYWVLSLCTHDLLLAFSRLLALLESHPLIPGLEGRRPGYQALDQDHTGEEVRGAVEREESRGDQVRLKVQHIIIALKECEEGQVSLVRRRDLEL